MTADLREALRRHLKFDVELVVNENRSTMLNVLEKRRKMARLSLHKMFLDAPEHVVAAIAHYIRGVRRDHPILREYIQKNLERYETSHRLDKAKLVSRGRVYDLGILYQHLNERYFEGKLDVLITWYGAWGHKNRSRITFGQYQGNIRLVKIHRLLDDPFFPEFFVSFVLYHEMLHAVVPGHVDKRGRFCVHGEAFKEREQLFEGYEEATAWEKMNKEKFFKGVYGRS